MAITLHSNAATDNGSTHATSVVVTGLAVSSGDLITCQYVYNDTGGAIISMSDTINGAYSILIPRTDNSTVGNYGGMYYFQNSGSQASATITLHYTNSEPFTAMSCQSWTGVATTGNIIDKTQQQNGTTSNPATGSNLTPSGNGELIIVNGFFDFQTPTQGTNYTLVGNNTASLQFSEYWIQTSATATNGPWTATTDNWTDQMAFISSGAFTLTPEEDFWVAPAPAPTDSVITVF